MINNDKSLYFQWDADDSIQIKHQSNINEPNLEWFNIYIYIYKDSNM